MLSTLAFELLTLQDAPPSIIVKIVEPPKDPTGLRDVLIGALGLTGVLALLAITIGVLMAGAILFVRRRQPLPSAAASASLEVSRTRTSNGE